MRPEHVDPGAGAMLRRIELAQPELRRRIRWARLIDVFWLELDNPREEVIHALTEIFHDPVLKWLFTGDLIPSAADKHGGMQDLMAASPSLPGTFWALERRFRPGVTDNVARTLSEALGIVLGPRAGGIRAASGSLLLMEGPQLSEDALAGLARDVFCNELIESWTMLSGEELRRNSRFHPEQVQRQFPRVMLKGDRTVERIGLDGLSVSQLEEMSRKRLWALSGPEMLAVREYYSREQTRALRKTYGLADPTDVEMEVIAQTWSEHCKHKIFQARIRYEDQTGENQPLIPNEVNSLFKETISGTTAEIDRPWLISVFKDNAGVVALDEEHALCIKVETHNSPSALDPYGGALTGIVGVNRDILGVGLGAKPIFNTDVFCLAVPDYLQTLPDRLLHPRRILDGVRRGVEHGGNKSGIPTVNGALVFDSRFLGKPLIFCGTGGLMPRQIQGVPTHVKEIRPGDRICMVGGRVGKDGIHGATFSSLALDEHSPVSAVQLGDPITQKRTADFLLEARDRLLFRTLTDNGAGGLSSSIGELATLCGGAKMDISQAKLKYPGLRPYEIVVSESQERMSMAVAPEKMQEFLTLAENRGVEVSVLGEFTDRGLFEIFNGTEPVGILHLDFLHDGNPRLELEAVWTGSPPPPGQVETGFDREAGPMLLQLLSRPNIASKEWMIRQYDHEVQGTSVVKPLHTVSPGSPEERSGPNDGAVLKPKASSWVGVAVGCGINPKLSDVDPYLMAQSAVDEAVRNVLAVGAEYGRPDAVLALVDNFCWPDPVNDAGKAAALVRTCYGLREAALALNAPLVSGKDSMKNDFTGRIQGQEVKISVPPTLLMTCVARVPDVRHARTSDFKAAGDVIFLLGHGEFGLLGSELHSLLSERLREKGGHDRQVVLPVGTAGQGRVRAGRPHWEVANRVYRWLGGAEGKRQLHLRSAHDVSEGGLGVALSECMIARGLGAAIDLPEGNDPWEYCFGEGFHSFLVTVRGATASEVEEELSGLGVPFRRLGMVTSSRQLEVNWKGPAGRQSFQLSTAQLAQAWKKEGYWE
ncbi:MAG: phosphoribosylformylglycinamidine synthase [Bdellovibrionales bacterium]|nr:phosphoribosylformylglycinamidine synthase [Bdellovibrionales bacterium]